MPAGRIVWIVTRKLMPVKMELKPRMNTPTTAKITGAAVLVL